MKFAYLSVEPMFGEGNPPMVKIIFRGHSASAQKKTTPCTVESKDQPERRRNPRHEYNRYIFCATDSLFFQGELLDYSRSGVFIKTNKPLPVGTIVTLALPYLEDKNNKCKGQVIRKTPEGVGVELFLDPAEKVTRLDRF